MATTALACLAACAAVATGCIRVAGGKLPPIEPAAPDAPGTLENVKTGTKYAASVSDDYAKWTHLYLLFAAPFAERAEERMVDGIADHLYELLRAQGAFER